MFIERLIEIGQAENGFIISCCVPLKAAKKEVNKSGGCCGSEKSCDRQYVAKDETEVARVVAELMPMLNMDYKSEEDFDAAYKTAVK